MRVLTKHGALIAVCWLAFKPPACRAEPLRLFGGAAYWRAYPSGTITITRGGARGSATRIDLSDDLDLGAADVVEGSIGAELGRHRFVLSYAPLSASGETTLGRAVVFHGTEFPARERVRSDVALRSIVPRYDYVLVDEASASLRAGVAAYVWTFDARLRGAAGDESRRFTHVLPAVGASGELPLAGWSLAASGSFGMVGSDRYGIELAPEVRRELTSWGDVAVGYRWRDLVFHETTNRGDVVSHGPFVALVVGFNLGGGPP